MTIPISTTGQNNDSLLGCLVFLTHFYERPYSADTLSAGLPLVQGRLTPRLFIRAAERAGFSAHIVHRPLGEISKLVLPVVLLLKNNQACILHRYCEDGRVEITFPELGEN